MRVLTIKHGKKKLKPHVSAFFKRCEMDPAFHFSVKETQFPKHAETLVKEHRSSADVIVVVGGDGTINEVVNGLLSEPGDKPPLLLIEAGTGNDLLRNFEAISFDRPPIEIFNQPSSKLHIGQIKTEKELHYFVNIADVGFGGKVAETMEKMRVRWGALVSYVVAVIWAFFRYRNKSLSVKFNQLEEEKSFFMIAVCLGSTLGNGMVIAPGKKRRDGQFHVVRLGRIKIWHYLLYINKLMQGKRINHPEISYDETMNISISGEGCEIEAEVDGERLSETRFTFTLAPNPIYILNTYKH